MEYFNDYFGKRYPLPKLDLVALNRLSVGAMENWGLITCRETGLIVEEKEGNPDTLQSVANLIAHEVNHLHINAIYADDIYGTYAHDILFVGKPPVVRQHGDDVLVGWTVLE